MMAASGTFGSGEEYVDFFDINALGGLVTKTITLRPREGNPPPRLVETSAGLLNAIGLENNGLEDFIEKKMPFLRKLKIPVVVSISGAEPGEFVELAERLSEFPVDGLELNISCPNVKDHRRAAAQAPRLIAQDPGQTYSLVRKVRRATKKTLIAKLSPNVTDITEMAAAAKEAGSDAVSLINTFIGMAVDIDTMAPRLGAVTGGLSGPAVKPMALRMVWEVFNKVDIPIIGIGGIIDYRDAVEFIICGATAVQVGTANFINPRTAVEIIAGIKKYLKNNKIERLSRLTGGLILSRNLQ